MPTTDRLTLACPAKVNLALSVAAPNAQGMHPIASWMTALTFSDELTLERLPQGPSRFDLAFDQNPSAAPRASAAIDWPLEKDLSFRAHALLQEHLQRDLPVRLTLRKRIPTGAGLGGGSSNAAATLVGLNRLFDLSLPREALLNLAGKLGSDVGFLLRAIEGEPSALVLGLGQLIEPVPRSSPIHLVLIFPPFGCPTGEVYRAFDLLPDAAPQADVSRVRALASASFVAQDAPFNDLARPACLVRPQLAELRRQLTANLKLPVHVTGSGSTLFIVAPAAKHAQLLAQRATQVTGLPAIATRTR